MISALTGEGTEALLAAIDARFAAKDEVLTLEIPATAGRLMSWLFDHAEVLRHESTEEGAMRARFRIDPILKGKLDAQLKRAGLTLQGGLRHGGGLGRS
jgi:GTP-binding protein HflX